MDKSKFIKLMMMTTSSHDNEALTAIRMANAMLMEANRNWEDFINGRIIVNNESDEPKRQQAKGRHDDASEIEPMFEVLLSSVKEGSSFRDFVESVHAFWERTGFLTDKQYQSIRKAAERV